MRIADNRPTISWVSVERKQNNKNQTKIPPNVDWFISSLLANYKQYKLDASTKSQLIYFVYLLLNNEFQSFLVRLRTLFDIPNDGFVETEAFNTWEKVFNQAANDFSNNKLIIRFEKILRYYESKTGKRTKLFTSSYIQENPTEELVHVLLEDFGISRPFFVQWLLFMSNVLFMPNPKQFLDSLARNIQVEKLFIENDKVTITLTRESTINSVQKTLNKNKDDINEAIQNIKDQVKETELEVEHLDRDYEAYKIYSNYSVRDNRYSRDRKVDKVIEKMGNESNIEEYNEGSIRKIASRMNQRIESTFTDRQRIFQSVLDRIEQASQ